MPGDPTWHYNLACALSYGTSPESALNELEKAIRYGFRDAEAISRDRDFDRIKENPRFKSLVAKARDEAKAPVPGRPVIKPLLVIRGQPCTLREENLLFDLDLGCYRAFMEFTGITGANAGDLYVNRDNHHSAPGAAEFPTLTRVTYAAPRPDFAVDHPHTLFPDGHAVFGNISRARVNGPYWRSTPRASYTDPGLAARMDLLYHANQLWFMPAVKDFGVEELGDLMPAAAPFQFVTQGASWSDLPFLRAALAASAALPPETKRAALERGLFAATMQWLFRRSIPGVETDEDYLSAKAHPTAFEGRHLASVNLASNAHALRPEAIPPTASLTLINSKTYPVKYPQPGLDYPDVLGEALVSTPSCIALVLRAPAASRTFLFRAQPFPIKTENVSFSWHVIHGDAKRVKIEPPLGETPDALDKGFAQITVDRRGLAERIDVGCFAKAPGTSFGMPAIISFSPVALEKRTYHADGRIDVIDYTNPDNVYCDPFIALPRHWADRYDYDASKKLLGFTRLYKGKPAASFTVIGERILSRKTDGTPDKTVRVRYLTRPAQHNSYIPLELTYADEAEER